MAAAMFKSFFPCRSFSVFLRSPLVCAKKQSEAPTVQEYGIEEPKVPQKPFFLFMSDKIDHVKKQNPNLSVPERVKKMKTMWEELSQSEKKRYISLYKTLHEQYITDMYRYYQELQKLPKHVTYTIPFKKRVLNLWKEKLGKPTCPPRAFMKFTLELAQKSGKPFTVPESINEGKKKWQQLTEFERKKYTEQAKTEWLKYDNELRQWEKKMIEDGHQLLVRAKSLKQTKNLTAIDP